MTEGSGRGGRRPGAGRPRGSKPAPVEGGQSIAESRRRKEAALAQLRELELAERAGTLVSKQRVDPGGWRCRGRPAHGPRAHGRPARPAICRRDRRAGDPRPHRGGGRRGPGRCRVGLARDGRRAAERLTRAMGHLTSPPPPAALPRLSELALSRIEAARIEAAALEALAALAELLDPAGDSGRWAVAGQISRRLSRFEAGAWDRIRRGGRAPKGSLRGAACRPCRIRVAQDPPPPARSDRVTHTVTWARGSLGPSPTTEEERE